MTLLAAGWAGVQVLAHRLGTKNHIDNAGSCGNGCACTDTGESCKNDNSRK